MMHEELIANFKNLDTAMELYQHFNVSDATLLDPHAVSKISDVASFVNEHKEVVPLLRGVAMKARPEERLDRTWNYISLQKKRLELEGGLKNLVDEIRLYE